MFPKPLNNLPLPPILNRIPVKENVRLTVNNSVNQEYDHRKLNWPDTNNIDFFVKHTNGTGNCYIDAVYQAFGSLKNLPSECLFLRDPNFILKNLIVSDNTPINYYEIDYNDIESLRLLIPGSNHPKSVYQTYLVDLLRRDLGAWLLSPYYDGEKYLTENEVINILKNNVENIKIWFFDKFYNPYDWTSKATKEEAVQFTVNILIKYMTNLTNLEEFNQYLDSLNIINFNNVSIENAIKNNYTEQEIWDYARPINFNNKTFSQVYTSKYLNILQQMNTIINQISYTNYEEMYLKEYKIYTITHLDINTLKYYINELLELYKNDIPPESVEVTRNDIINNRLKYVDQLYPLMEENNDIFAYLEYIKDKNIIDIIHQYYSNNSVDETLKTVCGFFTNSEYKRNIEIYINNLNILTRYVLDTLSINLTNDKSYNKYSKNMSDTLITVESIKDLARNSIYYKTLLMATDENINQEFNLDFRLQTTAHGPIIPKYVNENDYWNAIDDPDVDIINLGCNINYFAFNEGWFIRKQISEYSLRILHEDISTARKWSAHNNIFLISNVLGFESYILQSYKQNFFWIYEKYITNINNPPIVTINYTGNHYETCGYKNGNDYITYYSPEDFFQYIIKSFEASLNVGNKIITKEEWYENNKHLIQAVLPYVPRLIKLPGLNNNLSTIPKLN